jgi:hypothetical protein
LMAKVSTSLALSHIRHTPFALARCAGQNKKPRDLRGFLFSAVVCVDCAQPSAAEAASAGATN